MNRFLMIAVSLLLSAVMLFSLVSCDKSDSDESGTNLQDGSPVQTGVGDGTIGSAEGGIIIIPDANKEEESDNTPDAPDGGEATVTLSGTTATVTGIGASADGSVVTITHGGNYTVNGSLSDGRIIIDAKGQDVYLTLNGVTITCSYGSPLYCYRSSCVTVRLTDNTQNTLSDKNAYTYADAYSSQADEEPNAALYAKTDLTITGSGNLTVNGNANNGITSKDGLSIDGTGLITVNAVNHGVTGKDFVSVKNSSLTVTAGGDALRATNADSATLGYAVIENSTLNLISGEDGIQAESSVHIISGSITVTAGGGYSSKPDEEASNKALKAGASVYIEGGTLNLNSCDDSLHSNGIVNITGGNFTLKSASDGMQATTTLTISGGDFNITTYGSVTQSSSPSMWRPGSTTATASTDASSKGIKCDGAITLTGGSFIVNSSDDSLHANGNITVSGGEFNFSSGDDGIHSDATLIIGGNAIINITKAYEGIESNEITVNGGEINIISSDDGFNVAGGDGSSMGRPGSGSFTSTAGNLTINGGNITVKASGDGLDSNGSIYINGGTTVVSQSGGGNGPIDIGDGSNCVLGIKGGIIVAYGTMFGANSDNPSTSVSTQGCIRYAYSGSAGKTVTLKDSTGNTIVSVELLCSCSNIYFSAPQIVNGSSYTIYANNSQIGTVNMTSLFYNNCSGGSGGGFMR